MQSAEIVVIVKNHDIQHVTQNLKARDTLIIDCLTS